MLRAVFHRKGNDFCGFQISGHAGYGEAVSEWEGNDIVCAAVSSCTMLVCNAITEIFGAKAEVSVEEDLISLELKEYDAAAAKLIAALYEHLKALSEDYGKVRVGID